MRKLSIVILFIIFQAFVTWAEPQFALREGLKCSQCHVNKTGGGKRTIFGTSFAQTQLSSGHLVPEDADLFLGNINENVSVGANLRVDEKIRFSYEAIEPNSTSIFRDSVIRATETGRETAITEGNIYMYYQLIPYFFSLYWDQTVYPVSSTREFFGMLEGIAGSGYAKYGYMLLPYGLRLIDDADKAVVRSVTGYSYNKSDLALELGWEPGETSFLVNISSSNMSAMAQYIAPEYRLGISYGNSLKYHGLKFTENQEFGVFAGTGFKDIPLSFYSLPSITFMFEVDEVHRKGESKLLKARAYYSQLDIEVIPGVIGKFMYEIWHPDIDIDIARNGNTRTTFGVEYYPNPYMALSLLYRYKEGIPQNILWNQNDVIAKIHLFM